MDSQLSNVSLNEEQKLQLSDISSNEDFLNEEGRDSDSEEWEVVDEWQNGMGEDFDPKMFYTLGKPTVRQVKRFNTEGVAVPLKFQNVDKLEDVYGSLVAIFDDVIRQLLAAAHAQMDDRVGLHITHHNLDKPIIVPFCKCSEMTGEFISNWIMKVLQSNEDVPLDEMNLQVVVVPAPVGSGAQHRRRVHTNWKKWYDSHACGHGGCFIKITNNDDLCLARALVVAKARLHKDEPGSHWNSIRQGDKGGKKVQKRLAMELTERAGLKDHVGACGRVEMEKLQSVMPGYQIKVFSKDFLDALIYRGPDCGDDRVLHIYHHNMHYTVICSVPMFKGRVYYCDTCDKGYNNAEDHRCSARCACCYMVGACMEDGIKHYCNECNRWFKNPLCFNNHRKLDKVVGAKKQRLMEKSICDRFKRCKECGVLVKTADKRKKHRCGYFDCPVCRENVEYNDHQCYMPIDEEKEKDEDKEKPKRFVFFDFEATQEKEIGESKYGPIFEHRPNCCIAHVMCEECVLLDRFGLGCVNCGDGRKLFLGDGCLSDFCDWLFQDAERIESTVVAHNMKGYDGQFILQYLYEQAIAPEIIAKGLEVMSIRYKGGRIIDSINFIPGPLSAFPKTFGMDELKKGYFPHLFNLLICLKKENWSYIGAFPDAAEYGPANMGPEARQKFYEWYNDQQVAQGGESGTIKLFNFRKELLAYCESDVDILRRCCLAFRRIFMEETEIDPFLEATTIASACNKVFRRLFLQPRSIGIVPHGGYRRKDRQSIIGLKWLKWLSEGVEPASRFELWRSPDWRL